MRSKARAAAGVEGAERFGAVGEVADAAAELAVVRAKALRNFGAPSSWRTCTWPIVGNDGDEAVVAYLVDVLGGGENAGVDRGDGRGVVVWSQV